MDSRSSKKSRSIAIEPKSAKAIPASTRPPLAERTHSDPAIARRRTSQTQSYGQGQGQRKADVRVSDVKISDVIDRDSKTTIRDDPFFRPYQSPHSTRLAVEPRLAHGLVAGNEYVCSPPRAYHIVPADILPMTSRTLHGNPHADYLTPAQQECKSSSGQCRCAGKPPGRKVDLYTESPRPSSDSAEGMVKQENGS